MAGIKFTGTQLEKYLGLMSGCEFLVNEEKSEYLREVYNSTEDEDIKVVCKAYWRTQQAVADIEQRAVNKLRKRTKLKVVKF